jgi:hypothetical protein
VRFGEELRGLTVMIAALSSEESPLAPASRAMSERMMAARQKCQAMNGIQRNVNGIVRKINIAEL